MFPSKLLFSSVWHVELTPLCFALYVHRLAHRVAHTKHTKKSEAVRAPTLAPKVQRAQSNTKMDGRLRTDRRKNREGEETYEQRERDSAGRAATVTRPPVKRSPPAATRRAPPMPAGQNGVRHAECPWSTDDGRAEPLGRRLKAVLVGTSRHEHAGEGHCRRRLVVRLLSRGPSISMICEGVMFLFLVCSCSGTCLGDFSGFCYPKLGM